MHGAAFVHKKKVAPKKPDLDPFFLIFQLISGSLNIPSMSMPSGPSDRTID